ncbi:MAG: cytochrome c family protein [Rhodobacteraceae bacterium]|nr:cytochrome c family protein [Paracoccaceae bacterium]
MLDTMTATKIVGSLCGAMLFFMLAGLAAEKLYHVDHAKGGVIEVAYADLESAPAAPAEEMDITAALAAGDAGKGARVWAKCRACHKLEEGVNTVGPSLYNIIGQLAGSVPGFSYSDAMLNYGQAWTDESMYAFLANPREYMPGTKMSFAGLKKSADRADVIAYIRAGGN